MFLDFVHKYAQQGIFITYDVINQKPNGSFEEGDQLYTYSFYVTPEGQDWIYQVSVNGLEEGYHECLNWLSENGYWKLEYF